MRGFSDSTRRSRRGDCWWALACLMAVVGCSNRELNTSYGRQQEAPLVDSASVNGTDVLAGMFKQAGHDVARRRVILSGEFEAVDTIVWFPDDFGAPDEQVCDWLDGWLSGRPQRSVIYVGRDFDAGPLYWRKILALVPPDERQAYQEQAIQSDFSGAWQVNAAKDRLECPWFTIEPHDKRQVVQLAGPWSKGIDAGGTEIELGNRLVPKASVQRLLTSGADVLIARQQRPRRSGGKLILVENGSFLLNLPLVNHEHRKLAARLIESTQQGGRVVFLESGASGPPIDPDESDNSMWNVFGAWPLSAILLQLGLAGIIFCFARWPIFGRPRFAPAAALSDFGKHVDALGELLRRTRDRRYALAQLVDGESGAEAAQTESIATNKLAAPEAPLSP